jgi:hypothetical protein
LTAEKTIKTLMAYQRASVSPGLSLPATSLGFIIARVLKSVNAWENNKVIKNSRAKERRKEWGLISVADY